MPFGFWGISVEWDTLFRGPASLFLFLLAGVFPLFLIYHFRGQLKSMTQRQWAAVVALSGAALLLGRFIPITWPWSNSILLNQPATATVALLSGFPYLLAGAAINVPAAVIVGFVGGVARALGHTNTPVDIAGVAFVAGLAALMMRQQYSGRLFNFLRRPPIAGGLSQMVLAPLAGLQLGLQTAATAGLMGGLDLGIFVATAALLPLFIEGLVGGGLVVLCFWIAPQWRPNRGTVPSPFRRSLQGQVVGTFLTFALIVVSLTTLTAFILTTRSMARANVEQMITNVDAAAVRLGALQANLMSALAEQSLDNQLATGNSAEIRGAVGRLQRTMPQFSSIRFFDETGFTIAGSGVTSEPTAIEKQIVSEILGSGQARWLALEMNGETAIVLAMPVQQMSERAVLMGRVSPLLVNDIAGLLPGASGDGAALILDEQSQVVLRSGDFGFGGQQPSWSIPLPDQIRPAGLGIGADKAVYQTVNSESGAREFLYYTLVPGSGWKVVAAMPYAAVLRQTLGIMGPVTLVLMLISLAFFLSVSTFGRNIGRPLADVARASRAIAGGGGLERPIRSEREDEIGQLSMAFSQMQRALKQRLDELSLLLGVSNQVASTVNLNDGMKAVLQGVLRGTGASSARAIVRNPISSASLIFSEGTPVEGLSGLDRAVVMALRDEPELSLGSMAEIESRLGVTESPVPALYAIVLRTAEDIRGALIVSYRQPHYFDSAELGLLRTLAGQASVMVQNAHLYAAAESGRRRLAAILASTTNAVIVTDQTDRVLLLNPAMERILGLKAEDVTGRAVVDVVAGDLAHRLSMGLSAANKDNPYSDGKLELAMDGRSYLANIATVQGSDGHAMGRVAVLQDITDFVEVDRLKSEFLAGISHDLKSPLTYMQNYAGMLPIEDDPVVQREYVDKILAGIDRMSLLVNDLVEMAQIQAGINLQFERVQVADMLHDIADEYYSPALMQGVRLNVELQEDLPPVLGDPALLRRAITNYVTNGLKHAPNSGALILAATHHEGEIIISVRDNGPGISHIDQAHMFEKFYRGHKAAGNTRGSGLGLAIVKSIADHHSGRVWCRSRLGKGSIFYLAIPAISPETAQPL